VTSLIDHGFNVETEDDVLLNMREAKEKLREEKERKRRKFKKRKERRRSPR